MPTKINWCMNSDGSPGETWNPFVGCSHAGGPGCDHCYALRMAVRLAANPAIPEADREQYATAIERDPESSRWRWSGRIGYFPKRIDEPAHWNKGRTVFIGSMGDIFHAAVQRTMIDHVLDAIASGPQHTFLILTKRPDLMREFFKNKYVKCWVCGGSGCNYCAGHMMTRWSEHPYPNLWIGASVENQDTADARIPDLLLTTAANRFVSCEPLLGEIELDAIQIPGARDGLRFSALQRQNDDRFGSSPAALDWVVCGGETGPGARPCHPDWPRSLRDQCEAANVAFNFKQWGGDGWRLDIARGGVRRRHDAGRLLDGREHNDLPWRIRL